MIQSFCDLLKAIGMVLVAAALAPVVIIMVGGVIYISARMVAWTLRSMGLI